MKRLKRALLWLLGQGLRYTGFAVGLPTALIAEGCELCIAMGDKLLGKSRKRLSGR